MKYFLLILFVLIFSGCATTEELLAEKKEKERLKTENFQNICKSHAYEISTDAFIKCMEDLRNEDIQATLQEQKRINELNKARSSRSKGSGPEHMQEDLQRELERTRAAKCINNRGVERNCRSGF